MHSTEIGSLAPLYKTLSLLTYLLTKTSGETSRLMHHSRMTQPKARNTRAVPSMSVRVVSTVVFDSRQFRPTLANTIRQLSGVNVDPCVPEAESDGRHEGPTRGPVTSAVSVGSGTHRPTLTPTFVGSCLLVLADTS